MESNYKNKPLEILNEKDNNLLCVLSVFVAKKRHEKTLCPLRLCGK